MHYMEDPRSMMSKNTVEDLGSIYSIIRMLCDGHENYIKHLHLELDEANAYLENIARNPWISFGNEPYIPDETIRKFSTNK